MIYGNCILYYHYSWGKFDIVVTEFRMCMYIFKVQPSPFLIQRNKKPVSTSRTIELTSTHKTQHCLYKIEKGQRDEKGIEDQPVIRYI